MWFVQSLTCVTGKFKAPKLKIKTCSTAKDLDQDQDVVVVSSLAKTVSKNSFPIVTFASAISGNNYWFLFFWVIIIKKPNVVMNMLIFF